MRIHLKHIGFWVLIFLFSNLQNLHSQENEDSLYNLAVLNVYDNPDKSIEVGNKIFENNPHNAKKRIKALLLISNAYESKRDYEKSLEYALKTKEINKEINNAVLGVQIYSRIAAQYHQLGVNEKALQVLEEADQIISSMADKDSVRFIMGNNYAIRGFIYRDQLSCDIAIDYLNRAYNEFKTLPNNKRAFANMSVTQYNKGNCYITLKDLNQAKSAFILSHNLAEEVGANSLQAFSLKGLAEVYTLESKYNEALVELVRAEKLSGAVGDLVLNRGIYQGMADNYLALKNWEKFQEFNEKAEQTARLIKENERKTINTLISDYSQEIISQEKDLLWKYRMVMLGGILGIIVGIISIIWGQRNFRKSFEKLKSQMKL